MVGRSVAAASSGKTSRRSGQSGIAAGRGRLYGDRSERLSKLSFGEAGASRFKSGGDREIAAAMVMVGTSRVMKRSEYIFESRIEVVVVRTSQCVCAKRLLIDKIREGMSLSYISVEVLSIKEQQ